MWLAFGTASLIVAAGLALVFVRLARVLDETRTTMQKVETMLDGLQTPVAQTLDHVGGVAGNVDMMIGRVNRLTEKLENATNSVAKMADVAQSAVSPTVANVVGIVAGVSKGAQQFFGSRPANGSHAE